VPYRTSPLLARQRPDYASTDPLLAGHGRSALAESLRGLLPRYREAAANVWLCAEQRAFYAVAAANVAAWLAELESSAPDHRHVAFPQD
jgi:hypothetical protein